MFSSRQISAKICKSTSDLEPIAIKKARASNLGKSAFLYVLQPKTACEGSEILDKQTRSGAPFIVDSAAHSHLFMFYKGR